ncbi:hypothetical protein FSP39_008740 [Pinctada imbricata]|uniref:Major facilitator superfamily (MFS) profile domain-containing protein n=1 Tax=Pinctada imbricata TaxID=66713 RepID=A0AA88XZR8_PINIB|nr:hypothetical protein FSP39_008740 [Pinctada imbricata]
MESVVDVDKIWKALGVWKPYQIFQLAYIYVGTIPVAYPVLSWVFVGIPSLGYTPPYRCKTLNQNLSVYDIGIHGNLSDFHVEYDKCDLTIRPSNLTPDEYRNMGPKKFDCLDGYYFDHNEGETVTMEWNLVCGNAGLGGLSTTMVLLGMCLGATIFTTLADRYGRKTVAVYTHLALLGFQLALAFMPNLPSFAAVRLVLGALQQGLSLSTYVLIIEMFPMEWRGYLAFVECIVWAFCVFTLVAFAWFLRMFTWRYLQIALALVSFHALFGYWILDESLRWLIANQRTEEAIKIIRKAARWNGRDPMEALKILDNKNDEKSELSKNTIDETPDDHLSCSQTLSQEISINKMDEDNESSKKTLRPPRYSFFDILKNKILLRNSIILCYTWVVNGGTYYGLFLTSGSLKVGSRFMNFFINTLVEIPGSILFYLVIDRLGRKYTSIIFHGAAAISLITSVALLKVSEGDDTAAIASVIFSYLGKLAIGSSFMTIFMYTPELFPTNLRNACSGIGSAAGRLGGVVSSYSGVLMQYAIWAPGVLFGSSCLIATFLQFFLPETAGYILPQTIEEMEIWAKEQSYFRPYKKKKGFDKEKGNQEKPDAELTNLTQ